MTEAVTTISSVDALAAALRREVVNGVYAPGARLSDTQVADRFGVARHTVRAALARLESVRLLEFTANKGWSLPNFTEARLREVLGVREALEFHALMAITTGTRTPSEQVLEEHAAFGAVSATGADEVRRDRDVSFHRALVAESGNARLVEMFDQIMMELRLARLQLAPYEATLDEWYASHETILEAIRSGDIERVRQAFEAHVSIPALPG